MHKRPLVVALWLAAAAGFATIGLLAAHHSTFPLDVWMARHLQEFEWPLFSASLDFPEDLNDPPLLFGVWALACLGTLLWFGWQPSLLLAVWPLERVISAAVKELVGRPRPSDSLLENAEHNPTTFSFPSGHAGATMVLYGLLFYIATVYLKDVRLRLPGQALCAWVIVGTGLQRVYAGHHWPSDVIGGFWLGALILAALIGLRLLTSRRTPAYA